MTWLLKASFHFKTRISESIVKRIGKRDMLRKKEKDLPRVFIFSRLTSCKKKDFKDIQHDDTKSTFWLPLYNKSGNLIKEWPNKAWPRTTKKVKSSLTKKKIQGYTLAELQQMGFTPKPNVSCALCENQSVESDAVE